HENGESYRIGEASVASRIKNKLSFFLPEENSDVVALTFKSTSPQEAAMIVNLAMQIYVENSTRQNRQAATSTAQFLEKEKAEVKQKLDKSERRLREFMDATGIVRVNEQTTGMVQQQADVELDLQRSRLELQTIEQTIANYEDQLERIKPGLADQFTDAIGPKIRNSQEDLARYERERTMIITKNPGVLERTPPPARLQYLDEQIARLKIEIQELSDQLFTEDDEYMGMDSEDRAQIVSDLQTRLVELHIEQNQLASKIDGLAQFKDEMNADINSLPEGIVELAKLQRDVRINEELYINISRQYADMSVWKQSQFGFGRVIDPGQIPNVPVSPNKKILLLLGIMLGGLASAGFIFINEFRDNTVNDVGELKTMFLPSITVVPSFEKVSRRNRKDFSVGEGKMPAELVMLQDRLSLSSEAIRRLKNNIIYQYGERPPKTISVTSAEKGDGKSTIVANLGIAFAEDGYKTLIIGADFRRPKLGKYMGLSTKKGLSDYLDGKLSFNDLIRNTDQENLKVIVAGENTQTPEILVSSILFKQLLKKMEEVFDVIILDTPPFGIISDSSAILRNAEATVVVAKYRKTNRGMLFRTLEELQNIHANVTGVVLNDFDYRKETSNYYGAGYYQSLYTNYESYVK
ncbi:MAG: polysaccharide biosynthesis tyrosine autokinase, partial [Aliifodinibius sp.]|nr:polysaccharide biosynthesis tyrosine autokinase [Fodinibius sp.]NIV10809.1 polysaccharide biosynthesis tyrosine autokinase [Fodinibius sp.]NIY24408.1 polysaccharide biosynthesis tyrosine autokinase [Fodinibius sp.]